MTERIPQNAREKGKPFTMVLLQHDNRSLHELDAFKNGLEQALYTHPQGKIVAFVESPSVPVGISSAVEAAHAARYTFDESYRKAIYDYHFPPGSIQRRNRQRQHEPNGHSDLTIPHGFYRSTFETLDDLDARYKDPEGKSRITLVLEEQSPYIRQRAIDLTQIDLASHTDPIGARKQWIQEFAIYENMRTNPNIQRITDAMEDEDVVAGIGWMGKLHTKVAQGLRKAEGVDQSKRLDVTTVFPVRNGAKVYFDPVTKLVRDQMFFPDREISSSEVAEAYTMNMEIEAQIRRDRQGRVIRNGRIERYTSEELGQKEQHYLGKAYASRISAPRHSDPPLSTYTIDWAGTNDPSEDPKKTL